MIAQVSCTFQTYANFTDKYSAVFRIEDEPLSSAVDAYMKVTLIYQDVPVQIEQQGGMWLGIGFGSSSMLNADLVIC